MSNHFDEYVQLVATARAQFPNMSALEKYISLSELRRRNILERKFLDDELSKFEEPAMAEVLANGKKSIPIEGNALFGPPGRVSVCERRKTSVGFTTENLTRWLTSAMGEPAARDIVNLCINARKADTSLIPKVRVVTRVFKAPTVDT